MYLVYLDESGYSNIKKPFPHSQSDFFVLGGMFLKEEYYDYCARKYLQFKESAFPEECKCYPVHAVYLNQVGLSSKNPYNDIITLEDGKRMLKECYEFISTLPIEAIAVIIDNVMLRERYAYPMNPYELAYEYILERIQRIVKGRKENANRWALINLAKCSRKLTYNLRKLHDELIQRGGVYHSFENICRTLNVEESTESPFYEIADLICYAFQRCYFHWICENMGIKHQEDEDYIDIISNICTTKIGSTVINNKIHVKVFPKPRFLKE